MRMAFAVCAFFVATANPTWAFGQNQRCQIEEEEAQDASFCDACGTGMLAAGLLTTSPLSIGGAAVVFALSQAGVVSNEPVVPNGLPLWGCAVGFAAVHLFVAGVTTLAFWRDLTGLCGGFVEQLEEEDDDETYHASYRYPDGIPSSSMPVAF